MIWCISALVQRVLGEAGFGLLDQRVLLDNECPCPTFGSSFRFVGIRIETRIPRSMRRRRVDFSLVHPLAGARPHRRQTAY